MNDVFKDLFGNTELVKETLKVKKIDHKSSRTNRSGIIRFIDLEDIKMTEKLPNEFRSEFKNNLDSHTTTYCDSYCGLYATD